MERLYGGACEPRRMNALNLAFVGDCVFELFVRERLACELDATVNTMHQKSVQQVCCAAQARAAHLLLPQFTEEERAIYLRGRNAHVSHVPRNYTPAEYHAATALEAVFGYLYLCGSFERLRGFFEEVCRLEKIAK